MMSNNEIIGSLVYQTRQALNKDTSFLNKASAYCYAPDFIIDNKISFWHYPGTHNEISNTLVKLTEYSKGARLKFPSLLSFHPIREVISTDYTTIYLNLAFIAPVKNDWTTQRRDIEVFDKILRPIYLKFIGVVKSSRYFTLKYGEIPHTKYEVFTTGNNQGVLIDRYGDYIDAIEIHNLALQLKNCYLPETEKKIKEENRSVTADINDLLNK